MGRKRLSDDEKKHRITIRLPGWMIKELRQIEGYGLIIEKLIEEYLKNEKGS